MDIFCKTFRYIRSRGEERRHTHKYIHISLSVYIYIYIYIYRCKCLSFLFFVEKGTLQVLMAPDYTNVKLSYNNKYTRHPLNCKRKENKQVHKGYFSTPLFKFSLQKTYVADLTKNFLPRKVFLQNESFKISQHVK